MHTCAYAVTRLHSTCRLFLRLLEMPRKISTDPLRRLTDTGETKRYKLGSIAQTTSWPRGWIEFASPIFSLNTSIIHYDVITSLSRKGEGGGQLPLSGSAPRTNYFCLLSQFNRSCTSGRTWRQFGGHNSPVVAHARLKTSRTIISISRAIVWYA